MGFMTAFMILNDSEQNILRNKEQVANNVLDAMNGIWKYSSNSQSYPIGNYANPMKAFPSQHADTPQLFMLHQNNMIKFGHGSDLKDDYQLEYRKRTLEIAKYILEVEEEAIKELEEKYNKS